MAAIPLDIGSLQRAVASLEAALPRHGQAPNDDLVRDGCIQRFEFTYELSHKMLKRYLEAISANPAAVDALTFQDLIREGSERGLLMSDWSRWKQYRAARSLSSHTYDAAKAREVFAIVPEFLREARHLRDRLSEALS
jgi:nucleotidyltransferase substrate binding protein (TIGR01987 family)